MEVGISLFYRDFDLHRFSFDALQSYKQWHRKRDDAQKELTALEQKVEKLANAVRNIDPRTETEVWEIGAEKGVDYLKRLGLDMTEGVAEYVDDMAAATACRVPGR